MLVRNFTLIALCDINLFSTWPWSIFPPTLIVGGRPLVRHQLISVFISYVFLFGIGGIKNMMI